MRVLAANAPLPRPVIPVCAGMTELEKKLRATSSDRS